MITFLIWHDLIEDFRDDTLGLLGGIFFSALFSPLTLALDILLSPIEIISLIVFGIVKFIQWIKWRR